MLRKFLRATTLRTVICNPDNYLFRFLLVLSRPEVSKIQLQRISSPSCTENDYHESEMEYCIMKRSKSLIVLVRGFYLRSFANGAIFGGLHPGSIPNIHVLPLALLCTTWPTAQQRRIPGIRLSSIIAR